MRHATVRWLAAALALLAGVAGRADAELLNPSAFRSLGAFPAAPGDYAIDTGAAGAPTLAGPGGTFRGVYYADAPGHTIAVFTFDAIAVGGGTTLRGGGPNVLALLSRSDVRIAGLR